MRPPFKVGSVKTVPRVHGAVAPGEPLAAALDILPTTLQPFRLADQPAIG